MTTRTTILVVSSPRPEVEPPVVLFEGPGNTACVMTDAEVRGLVWDVLGHALGAESPRETLARLARDSRR